MMLPKIKFIAKVQVITETRRLKLRNFVGAGLSKTELLSSEKDSLVEDSSMVRERTFLAIAELSPMLVAKTRYRLSRGGGFDWPLFF